MKKALKVIAVFLLLFVISIGCLAVWQKDNVASLVTSLRYSKEELAQRIDSNKKQIDEIVERATGVRLRSFNHEEEEQIRRGEITAEQAFERVINELNSPALLRENAVESEDSASVKSLSTIINEHISRMYKLKAQYIGKLGDVERRAIKDYNELPKDKKGSSGQQLIISKYFGEAAGLETECDGKVNEILTSLQNELIAHGGDLELIKTMRKAYEEEKILKKSYYINTYR